MIGISILFIRLIIGFKQHRISLHDFFIHGTTSSNRTGIFIECGTHTQYQLRRLRQVYIYVGTDSILHQVDIRIKVIPFIYFHITVILRNICCYIITGYRSTSTDTQISSLIDRCILKHSIIPVCSRVNIRIKPTFGHGNFLFRIKC